MFIVVIPVKNYLNAKQQIEKAQHLADAVELRLDYLNPLDLQVVCALRKEFTLPMVFTLRKRSQGGLYPHDEAQRLQDIRALCQLGPDYMDIEYDVPKDFLENIKKQHPQLTLMGSYHNFTETPEDLNALFKTLQHPCFDTYKIAVQAKQTLDALRMLEFVKTHTYPGVLTGISMGEEGQCTRILSPVVGNALHYCALDENNITAPGQLTLDALLTVYGARKCNKQSKIYALLGSPVHLSVGHILHNQALAFLQENAVYIKLQVARSQLPAVFEISSRLSFAGFSITMPLKKDIIPLLDGIDAASKHIGAINSVVRFDEKYWGFNTDGLGAIEALTQRMDIAHKTLVILGAGGSAQAIAYEALQKKADVIILNRSEAKAKQLADTLGCSGYALTQLASLKERGYSVLINTLPENAYLDKDTAHCICSQNILPHILAMDIVYQPQQTLFLQIAKNAKCVNVLGYNMYINQALLQIKRWFQPTANQLLAIKENMQQYFLKDN